MARVLEQSVRSAMSLALAGLTLLALMAAAPREAAACPLDNAAFLGPCGPSLQLPPWGNGSWSRPEYYATIQTGDVDGDGAAELLGRTAVGLEVHTFDVVSGLWLPFFDADDQFVLTEFSDLKRPNSPGLPEWAWDKPQYYETIQAGDIDGDGRDEILGRGALGMVVWDYDPTTNTWSELPGGLGFTDAEDFDQSSVYNTIQTANIDRDTDGKAELLVRGFRGMIVFSFDGTKWTRIGQDGPFPGEFDDWNEALYYETIQTGDIDGDGAAELLGRGADGVRAYSWAGSGGEGGWTKLNDIGPFTDAEGWGHPQYFFTIQTANIDDDTDGKVELLGRAPSGIEVWSWDSEKKEWKEVAHNGPMNDGVDNFDHPQYYRTIQTADLDGEGGAELLARGAFGIEVFNWTGSGWDRIIFKSPELDNTYETELFGAPTTVPLWQEPHYYLTIQTANIDGDKDGKAELLARGSFGIRTWRLDTSEETAPVWARYQPYGYPSPAFPTPEHQAAYEALGAKVLMVTGNDVRTNLTNGYGNVLAPVVPGEWLMFEDQIKDTCTAPPISEDPPQYQSCTPPSGTSGFDAAEWTFVANEIIAELFYAQKVVTYHTELQTMQKTLFATSANALNTIVDELKLDAAMLESSKGAAAYLTLFADVFEAVGTVATAVQPEVGIPISILGYIMGSVASASPALSSHSLVLERTTAEAAEDLQSLQDTRTEAINANLSLVRGDLGMLKAVGGLVTMMPSKKAVWGVDSKAYESAARQGFATWVYQTFLPVFWVSFDVTGCNDDKENLLCEPAVNSGCDPKNSPDDIGSCYLGKYENDGSDFTGLFPPRSGLDVNGCISLFMKTECSWDVVPNQNNVNIVWGDLTGPCTYEPKTGTTWNYSNCNLVIPTGPDSDIFNNRNGWDFPTKNCDPECDDGAVQGRVPIGLKGGRLQAAVTVPLPDGLDLRFAEVSLDQVLHERGGAGELARDPIGLRIDPDSLLPITATPKVAVFRTFPSDQPRMLLLLRAHQGQLEARLKVQGLVAREPALCQGITPTTDLWTSVTVDDGINPPTELRALTAWECLEDRNEDRELRAAERGSGPG